MESSLPQGRRAHLPGHANSGCHLPATKIELKNTPWRNLSIWILILTYSSPTPPPCWREHVCLLASSDTAEGEKLRGCRAEPVPTCLRGRNRSVGWTLGYCQHLVVAHRTLERSKPKHTVQEKLAAQLVFSYWKSFQATKRWKVALQILESSRHKPCSCITSPSNYSYQLARYHSCISHLSSSSSSVPSLLPQAL